LASVVVAAAAVAFAAVAEIEWRRDWAGFQRRSDQPSRLRRLRLRVASLEIGFLLRKEHHGARTQRMD